MSQWTGSLYISKAPCARYSCATDSALAPGNAWCTDCALVLDANTPTARASWFMGGRIVKLVEIKRVCRTDAKGVYVSGEHMNIEIIWSE